MCQRWTNREIDNQLFAELAKSNPDVGKVRSLINFGADINAVDNKGETMLFNAIFNTRFGDDLKYIRLLIDAGADLCYTVGGMNCLYVALMSGKPEIVAMLLDAGANPNCFFDDPPASLLDWAEAKLLFDELCHGCDVTPMKKIVQLLKSHGARSITQLVYELKERSPDIVSKELVLHPYTIYREV